MKSKIKLFFLGSVPTILPESFLLRYWIILSQFQRFFRKSEYIQSIQKYQRDPATNLFLLKMSDGEFLIQNLRRVSRFLRGRNYATNRLFNQYVRSTYNFSKLITEDCDQFVVFDIGANVGEFSVAVACRFPNSLIYAFEPDPIAYECLKFNVNAINLSTKIVTVDKALSNQSGLSSFYVSTANADSSLIEPSSYSNIIKLNCITGDQFMQNENIQNISLLKMDAEGFEPEILEGFGGQLIQIDFFAIDVGPERAGADTEIEVTQILGKQGLQIDLIEDDGTRKFINAYRTSI